MGDQLITQFTQFLELHEQTKNGEMVSFDGFHKS